MIRVGRHLVGIHLGAIGLLAAVSGAWYVAGFQPLLSAKQRAAELGEEAGRQREDVHALVVERDRRAAQLVELERDLSKTTVRLKPASALNAQLAAITQLAESERIVVDRVEPGAPLDTPLAIRVPVTFAGRGTSAAAVRFLASLRGQFPDISVERFEVAVLSEAEAKAPAPGQPSASFRFECVWYADRAAERTRTTAAPSDPPSDPS